ncbi:hypothetical protein [Pseudaminobacter soli (ex Zhang et al. 2022)]|nr:hypothetical protein [Pseudaminobacter soli]
MMGTEPSRAIRLYGTEQVDPPLRTLRAGPLTVEFDNGALRYVRVAGIEVLRGIAFLVRKENWGTFTPDVENLRFQEDADGFTVTYRATCGDASRRIVYDARIEGRADGSLSFVAEAEPLTDLLTNRTGFIVLHPIEGVAGQPVKVLHEDGREQVSQFPEKINPRCPFTDIRALSHEIAPGTWATCTMEGDAFEMEDQRNWSDASYKTYVRPLRRPWPYTLPKGVKFTQAVRLEINGPIPEGGKDQGNEPVVLELGEVIGKMPMIGIGVPAEEAAPALERPELIKRLVPRWLVCEIDLRRGHGRSELEKYRKLADLTGAEVTLEIITKGSMDPFGELQPLAHAVQEVGLAPQAVAVFPAQDMKSVQPDAPWPEMPTFEETYAAARRAFPGVKLGGGMAAYFTELNRKRPPADRLDYVSFTTCPNVHAADDISVMETLESVPHLIRSARAFMGEGVGYRIGPSQLGCRENPYGNSTAPNEHNGRVCLSRVDPRQRGLFTAAWTIGYIAACAEEGIDAVALGASTGPFGHIYRMADFEQPWYDEQNGSLVYPSYHVMSDLAASSGAELLAVRSCHGVKSIAVWKDGRVILWVANLQAQAKTIEFLSSDRPYNGRITMLSADQFERIVTNSDFVTSAMREWGGAIELHAYSVARFELS